MTSRYIGAMVSIYSTSHNQKPTKQGRMTHGTTSTSFGFG